MVSFKTTGFVAAAALATVAQADYTIDPKTVPFATRGNEPYISWTSMTPADGLLLDRWCRDEKLTCPMICQQTEPRTTLVNDCDPETLMYGCLCGNNKQPNISEYSLSIPYYCVNKCNNNNMCASDCLQNHPCGATNPQRYNASATSSQGATAAKTGSDGIYTGPPGSANDGSSGKKSGAGSALEAGRSYGFAVVFVGLFAGFTMLERIATEHVVTGNLGWTIKVVG
ncbi:hypothetical protein CCM_07653 [Cordyceps militaris CM01]|uniref:DUF7707 domain-containing protein n=1 Tax=Cordyceps militaris (strain CM01) TaxID=983644 RepID=G3JQV7_CORMM|nr:uncharacterized protein CCM_07653 [Cordyceps militaris CM01]EGX89401.1 hypothetical protein CCM_07653 [Cordyceps militaris CM01]